MTSPLLFGLHRNQLRQSYPIIELADSGPTRFVVGASNYANIRDRKFQNLRGSITHVYTKKRSAARYASILFTTPAGLEETKA